MATTLYDSSVPIMLTYLERLSGILKKTEEFVKTGAMKEDELLKFRLRDDMQGIIYQVQSCSNTANFLVSRVAGQPHVAIEDNETTLEQLQARIDYTTEVLKAIKAEDFNKDAEKELIMETKSMGNFKFVNKRSYVLEFAVPNFFFHYTTAYCIVRHLGVKVGALDYLAKVFNRP